MFTLVILLAAITGHVYSSSLALDRKAILAAMTKNDGLEMIGQMGDYYKGRMIQRMDRFGMSCDACKNANTFVGDNIFGNEKIRKYVLEAVKLASPCTRVPVGVLRNTCIATVTSVFDLLWDQQLGYWANAKLCYQIRLCNSSELTSSQLQKVQEIEDNAHSHVTELMEQNKFSNDMIKSLGCRICKAFTNIISDIIFENEQIKEFALNFVKERSPCANMTRFAQRACYDTLTAAFQFLWQQTDKDLSNGRLCKSIRLCDGSQDALFQMVEDKGTCQFCETMVSFIKPVVEQNSSFDNLEKSCTNLECKTFISTYGMKVVQMIENNIKIQPICKAIGYCL